MNNRGVGRPLDSLFVMKTYDFVAGLHNCLEFDLPTPIVFISGYAKTENVFYCLSIIRNIN